MVSAKTQATTAMPMILTRFERLDQNVFSNIFII
jgi:hypothetical protein